MSQLLKTLYAYNSYLLLVVYCIIAGLLMKYNEGAPVQTLQSGALELRSGIARTIDGVQNYFALRDENRQLIRQNAFLLSELLTTRQLNRDLPDLTNLSNYIDLEQTPDLIPARVVDWTSDSKENLLVVSAGSRQGVRKDMAVLTPDGLVGRVVRVSPNYAGIMPLIHPDFSVSVVSDSNRTHGILRWDGKDPRLGSLLNVPLSSSLSNNENISTSDFSTFALRGIPAGQIIRLEEGKQFYDATVRLAVDFSSLHYVLIAEKTPDQEKQLLTAPPEKP